MKYLPFLFAASFTVPSLADTVVIAQNGLDYFPREAQSKLGTRSVGNGPMAPTMWHLEQIARKTASFTGCSATRVRSLNMWLMNHLRARRWNITAPWGTIATLA